MSAFRRLTQLISLAALLLLSFNSAYSVEVDTLYQISIPVQDRSSGERVQAIKDSFAKILVKVSGSSSVVSQQHVLDEQARAERYVVQYGYESRKMVSGDDLDRPVKVVFLNVKFDSLAVNQFLRRNGNAIWANNRPKVVIWAAYDGGSGRQLLGGASAQPLQQLFSTQAELRGLPILFPAYDQEDNNQVRAGDIWGMFVDPIERASARYQANVVLVVKSRELQAGAKVSAMLVLEGQQHWIELEAVDMATVVPQFVEQVADRVGEHYAVLASSELGQQVILEVDAVDKLASYANLSQYLDSVLAIRGVQLQQLQGGHLRYLLTLESSLDALQQSFRLDKKLLAVDEPLRNIDPPEPEYQPVLGEDGSPISVETDIGDGSETDDREQSEGLPVIHYHWQGSVSAK